MDGPNLHWEDKRESISNPTSTPSLFWSQTRLVTHILMRQTAQTDLKWVMLKKKGLAPASRHLSDLISEKGSPRVQHCCLVAFPRTQGSRRASDMAVGGCNLRSPRPSTNWVMVLGSKRITVKPFVELLPKQHLKFSPIRSPRDLIWEPKMWVSPKSTVLLRALRVIWV